MITLLKADQFNRADFIVADPEQVCAKIQSTREHGPESLAVHFDLDKTLIIDSTWVLKRNTLEDEKRREHERLSRKYGPLLDDDTLTREQAFEWQTQAVELLVGASAMQLATETRRAQAKRGALPLTTLCTLRGVTKVVQTATTRLAARNALRANGLDMEAISATELTINPETGTISGYKPATLTTDVDKGSVVTPELIAATEGKTRRLVVGDRKLDTLLSSDPDAFRARTDGRLNPADAETTTQFLLNSFRSELRYPHPFDAVAIHDNLLSMTALVDNMTCPEGHQPRPLRLVLLDDFLERFGAR